MKKQLARFVTRWIICSLGLWIAAGFLSESISYSGSFWVIIIAGLILAILNSLRKPLLVVLALPALLFSLGLFMIVINGFTVFIASKLYHPLHVTNFWAATFAGIIIGLVNYLVSAIVDRDSS